METEFLRRLLGTLPVAIEFPVMPEILGVRPRIDPRDSGAVFQFGPITAIVSQCGKHRVRPVAHVFCRALHEGAERLGNLRTSPQCERDRGVADAQLRSDAPDADSRGIWIGLHVRQLN